MEGGAGAGLIPEDLVFAEAGAADWPGIWSVFRDVVATADTYPYPPNISEEEARRAWIKDDGARETTFVTRIGDEIVATAYLKPNQPGLGDHVANAGWMVSPSHQGHGVGRRFAEYVIDQARQRGYRAMQFNSVVSTNTGAIKLWESLGFVIVGTVPDAFRHPSGPVAIHVMYREL